MSLEKCSVCGNTIDTENDAHSYRSCADAADIKAFLDTRVLTSPIMTLGIIRGHKADPPIWALSVRLLLEKLDIQIKALEKAIWFGGSYPPGFNIEPSLHTPNWFFTYNPTKGTRPIKGSLQRFVRDAEYQTQGCSGWPRILVSDHGRTIPVPDR